MAQDIITCPECGTGENLEVKKDWPKNQKSSWKILKCKKCDIELPPVDFDALRKICEAFFESN